MLCQGRVKEVAIQRTQKKKEINKKGEKRPHRPDTVAGTVPAHWLLQEQYLHTGRLQDVAFCAENVESNYQGWRLSQNCYHTCSYQEDDRSWIKTAFKGQELHFMSCSEDISHIYSCSGTAPVQTAQKKLYKHCSLLGWATITARDSPNTDFGSCCSHGLE